VVKHVSVYAADCLDQWGRVKWQVLQASTSQRRILAQELKIYMP
jgi:hypothetical protein